MIRSKRTTTNTFFIGLLFLLSSSAEYPLGENRLKDGNQTLNRDQIENFVLHSWQSIPELTVKFEIYDLYVVWD